jgi:hypothetical protein
VPERLHFGDDGTCFPEAYWMAVHFRAGDLAPVMASMES